MSIPEYAKNASAIIKRFPGTKVKLSSLENKNGGCIVELQSRANATDVPTLVISLGGLGGMTLNKIKERYIKTINDKDKIIDFLAIDTSEPDLQAIRKSMASEGYLDDTEYAMVASHLDPALIDIVINTKNNPRCPQAKWMDKNIPDSTKIDTNGAQCRRQIGRLMLSHSTNYNNLLNIIRAKIQNLSDHAKKEVQGSKPINIILVAGISGGTGSGTIVDISYMVRLALAMSGGLKPQFDAILYTPDVQFKTGAKKDALQRNFVAAMKEIDAYMKAEDAREKYVFPCEKFPDGKVLETPLVTPIGESCPIFDSCTLVQAYDSAGGSLERDTVISNVTNYVSSLLSASMIVDFNDNQVQLSRAISNNKAQYEKAAEDLQKNNIKLPRDVYYCYNAMGYSAVKFQVEEIMTVMAGRTSMALIELFDKAVQRDVLEVMTTVGLIPAETDLNSDSLYEVLFEKGGNVSCCQRIVSLSRDLSFNDIKGDDERPGSHNNKINAINFENDWISNVYDNIEAVLKEEMKKNGPFAAKKLCQSVREFLNSMANRFAEICRYYENKYKEFEDKATKSKNESVNIGGIFSGKKKEDVTSNYINAIKSRDLYYWKKSCLDSGNVRNCLTELLNRVNDLEKNIYERYVGAFTAIAEILQKDSMLLTEKKSTAEMGRTFSTNMLNVAEMNDENSRLSLLAKHYLTSEKVADMSNAVIQDMMDNVSAWTGTTQNDFKAVENMKRLFKNQFNTFINDTIEKLLVVKYTEKADINDICNDIDNIINNGDAAMSEDEKWDNLAQHCLAQYDVDPIEKAAKDIYNQAIKIGLCATPESAGGMTSSAFPGGFNAFYNYKIFCLMSSTKQINKVIEDILKARGRDDSCVNGISDVSEVTYLDVVSCLPLYYFKGMLSYQEEYAKCLVSGSNADAGMHMDCGEEAPWKMFSPLCSNLTIEVVEGKAQALSRSDYQAEEKIFTDIKEMADFCLSSANGFIEFTEDDANLSYIDKDLCKNNELDIWQKTLLDSYRNKIQNAVSDIEVPRNIADASAYWDKEFSARYENDLPSMKKLMEENGYIFASRSIKAASVAFLPVCGENALGEFDNINDAESGSFYKNIRRSTETRNRLKDIYDMAVDLSEKMNAIKEEVITETKGKALEKFKASKNAVMIDIMIQAILSGYISIEFDKDSMALNAVMVDSLADDAAVVSAETFRYAGKRVTELKYLLFGVFSAWFLNINADDEDWWNAYVENVNDTYSKNIAMIKAENKKEAVLALMPEKSDMIKYESVLIKAKVYQKVNSAFEGEKLVSSAYSTPIDNTMMCATKDDYSLASQLEFFYNRVEEFISNC